VRLELFWNPRLLVERLAAASLRRRRLAQLRNTPAAGLSLGHLDTLELLQIVRGAGIHVVYDIGANIGMWVRLAKSVIPGVLVEAFEPLQQHIETFRRNCASLGGVNLHPVALGGSNTTRPLHVTKMTDASSFLPVTNAGRSIFGLTEIDLVTMTVRRLDDYAEEHRLLPPDLMKLDVQGFELEVLSGSTRMLRHAKGLIVEVSFVELYENQCQFPEVCRFLDDHGFAVHAFGSSTPVGERLVQADVLFMKRDRSGV